MITIAWYNVVAIVAGILFVVWLNAWGDDSGPAAGVGPAFIVFVAVIFYAVWGGIYWW